MSYLIEIIPLQIIIPPMESLDIDMRHALCAYRLGLRHIGNSDNYEVWSRYCEHVDVRMESIDSEHELAIWFAFLKELAEDEFPTYLGNIPYQILEQYERARNTGIFTNFSIWKRDNPNYALLVGYIGIDFYILAKWQPSSDKPITFDLIKQWVREGLYPELETRQT